MKKQNVIITVVGLVALVAGGILVYRLFTKKEETKGKLPAPEEPQTVLGDVASGIGTGVKDTVVKTGNALLDLTNTIAGYIGSFNSYSVNTISSNLYIRETPAAQGKILGKYAKGTIIKARPSKTKGWFEVSEDGSTVKGYVSGVYLKAEPTK